MLQLRCLWIQPWLAYKIITIILTRPTFEKVLLLNLHHWDEMYVARVLLLSWVNHFLCLYDLRKYLFAVLRVTNAWYSLLCFPVYLCDYCIPVANVAARSQLRSASRHQVVVPRYNTSTFGRRPRAFSVAGPTVWNSLPDKLRDPTHRYRLTVSVASLKHSCLQTRTIQGGPAKVKPLTFAGNIWMHR